MKKNPAKKKKKLLEAGKILYGCYKIKISLKYEIYKLWNVESLYISTNMDKFVRVQVTRTNLELSVSLYLGVYAQQLKMGSSKAKIYISR